LDPKISVIITSFNRLNFLTSAIDSVLKQTFENFELIILDNSSDDGTKNFLETIVDRRVSYIIHEKMGISKQRNLGLRMAQSNYVAFLDDDDIWLPTKLENQYNAIVNNSNAALVYGGFCFYSDDGSKWGYHVPSVTTNHFIQLLTTNDPFCGSASNPLLNKKCVSAVGGYDESVEVGEDWELYLRLAKDYVFLGVDEVLIEIRQHFGPRLGDKVDKALDTDQIVFDKHHSLMDKNTQLLYMQKIAFKYMRIGERMSAFHYLRKATLINFLSPKNYVLYLFLLLPRKLVILFNNLRRRIRSKYNFNKTPITRLNR